MHTCAYNHGFLNFAIYFINGKLLHSPEPILNALILFLPTSQPQQMKRRYK